MTNLSKLTRWKKLAEEATGGPWINYPNIESEVANTFLKRCGLKKSDLEFIAASREAVPLLIEQLERAMAHINAVKHIAELTQNQRLSYEVFCNKTLEKSSVILQEIQLALSEVE